jgi:hypothetical protein
LLTQVLERVEASLCWPEISAKHFSKIGFGEKPSLGSLFATPLATKAIGPA